MASEAKADAKRFEQVHTKGKACFKQAVDAWAKQRTRDKEDLRFQIAENQWTEDAKKARKGRPMLSISLLRQPQALVRNQASNAKLGLNLHPVSEDANEELAEIKQGLYRRIEQDGKANQARLWALAHAVQCGLGWYRVNTQWDEDGDDPYDQEIVFERIVFQESVYPDPAALKPDFSDAEYFVIPSRWPHDKFKREFPNAQMAAEGFDFADVARQDPEWTSMDGEKASIVVAEYFYKVHDLTVIEDRGRKRTMDKVTVRRALLTAVETLEDDLWNGNEIPFVPVIWEELQPIDGERIWEGMTRPARDGQMTFNYAISSIVEDVSRLSKAPVLGAAGAFKGFEKEWGSSNLHNYPYLEYNTIGIDGKPVPPPSPIQIDGTKMALSVQLAQEARGLVQVATAIHEPSLGETSKRKGLQSGRAILAEQQQSDAATSNGIDNLVSITLPREAKIVLNLMPVIYDRPGRITSVLGGEDEPRAVMLNQAFVNDPVTGRPKAVPEGTQGAKINNLAQGKYSVVPSAGKSFQTRLEQGATEMGEILSNAPELMPIIGDLYFKFRDFPGAKEISERLAKWREKQNPGLGDDKNGPTAEQAQMQVQALQQQLQEMSQQLQMASRQIETDAAKQQGAIETAKIKAQADIEMAHINNAAKIEVARISAANGALDREASLKEELLSTGLKLSAEAKQNDIAQQHETRMAHEDRAHDVAMAHAGGNTVTRTREGGQEQDSEHSREETDGASEQQDPPEEVE